MVFTDEFKSTLNGKNTIIWDYNGTILDDSTQALEAVNDLLKLYNLPLVDRNYYLSNFGFPIENFYKNIGLNTQHIGIDILSEQFVNLYRKKLPKSQVHSLTLKLLNKFRALNLSQFILSAADQETLNQSVDQQKLNLFFKGIYGLSDKRAHSKVELGRNLLSNHNLNPNKCLILGDTDHDFEVGTTLGCQTILIPHGHQDIELLRSKTKSILCLKDIVNFLE